MDNRTNQLIPTNLLNSQLIANGTEAQYAQLFHHFETHYKQDHRNIFNQVMIDKNAIKVTAMFHVTHKPYHHYPWHVQVCQPEAIGKGGIGSVYRVQGKIKFNENESRYKSKNNQVLKIKHFKESKDEITHEKRILKKLSHLQSKTDITRPNLESTVLQLRYIPGNNLVQFIETSPGSSTLEELILCLSLLKALKEQFHDQNIVHRDIKPSNILLTPFPNEYPLITFIDTDSSRFIDENNGTFGTNFYCAPEGYIEKQKIHPHATQSDHFSIILTMMELLSHQRFELIESPQCKKPTKKSLGHALVCADCFDKDNILSSLAAMFKKIESNLPMGKYNALINDYFKQVLLKQPEERPSINEGIQLFEKIIILFELQYIRQEQYDAFYLSYDIAKSTYQQLKTTYSLPATRTLLESQLELIEDNPIFIKKFTHTLGLRLFFDCTTKNDILMKMNHLIHHQQMLTDLWYEKLIVFPYKTKKYLLKIEKKIANYLPNQLNGITLDLQQDIFHQCDHHYQKLFKCAPSIYHRTFLDLKFGGNRWKNIKSDDSEIRLWLAESNVTDEPVKLFFLHYHLLKRLTQNNISEYNINRIANLNLTTLTAFLQQLQPYGKNVDEMRVDQKLFQKQTMGDCIKTILDWLPAHYRYGYEQESQSVVLKSL